MVSGKAQQFSLKQGDFNIGRVQLLQLLKLHGSFLPQIFAQQQSDGRDATAHPFVAGRWKAEQGFWRRICHQDIT